VRSGGDARGVRFGLGIVAIAIVTLAARSAVSPDAWIVFVSMVAGVLAVAIAARLSL
jgi:hypothetical protein